MFTFIFSRYLPLIIMWDSRGGGGEMLSSLSLAQTCQQRPRSLVHLPIRMSPATPQDFTSVSAFLSTTSNLSLPPDSDLYQGSKFNQHILPIPQHPRPSTSTYVLPPPCTVPPPSPWHLPNMGPSQLRVFFWLLLIFVACPSDNPLSPVSATHVCQLGSLLL